MSARNGSNNNLGLEIDEAEEYLFDSLNNSPEESPSKQLQKKENENDSPGQNVLAINPTTENNRID